MSLLLPFYEEEGTSTLFVREDRLRYRSFSGLSPDPSLLPDTRRGLIYLISKIRTKKSAHSWLNLCILAVKSECPWVEMNHCLLRWAELSQGAGTVCQWQANWLTLLLIASFSWIVTWATTLNDTVRVSDLLCRLNLSHEWVSRYRFGAGDGSKPH